MTKVLLIVQEKGGVGKTLIARGLAEVVPGAPVIEVDASHRMIELGKRVKYFKTRADREDIERTGGAAARSEFDQVVDAIASSTLPTIVDIGANTGVALLTVIADLIEDLAAGNIEFGILVVTTAEPGALAEVPRLLAIAAPFTTKQFVIDNRSDDDTDVTKLASLAAGATVTRLLEQHMDKNAGPILDAGGLASILKLDPDALRKKFGTSTGGRIRRDLKRARLEVMKAVRLPAEWLIS
jgi:hypothetical protein